MTRRHGLSAVAAVAAVGMLGIWAMAMDPPEDDIPEKQAKSGQADRAAKTPEQPTTSAQNIEPKPLSENVKKGLEYLVSQQHKDGGWGQGGGWRTATQGGRVEGAEVEDPSDVGNTCIAALALIRAGSTPKSGPYANNVARAIDYINSQIKASDEESLFITSVRGTQLQSKIGQYVDTFLAALVLSEL